MTEFLALLGVAVMAIVIAVKLINYFTDDDYGN